MSATSHRDSACRTPAGIRLPAVWVAIALTALGFSGNAGAQGNAYNYIVSGGYSYGSQARWTIGQISHNEVNMSGGGFTSHVLWVGTNNTTFVGPNGATWMEVGVTRGFNGDPGLFYYAARGINYPGFYEEANLNWLPSPAPLPNPGENHLFSVLNSHGDPIYFSCVDNVCYWGGSGHTTPSPDYGIGIETTCSGCSNTYVRATPVTSPQWEDAGFNFYTTDNGQFRLAGSISGATQLWCSYPWWFVQALATGGVTC